MSTKKIERFLDTVYGTAEERSNRMIREVDRAKESALSEYRAELKRSMDAKKRRESARVARLGAQTVAHDETEIRRAIIARRDVIEGEIFSEVVRGVEKFRESAEYRSMLVKDARAVADAMEGMTDPVILVSERDLSIKEQLETVTSLPVMADASILLGGVKGRCAEMDCDCTFDSRLDAAKKDFREESGLPVV